MWFATGSNKETEKRRMSPDSRPEHQCCMGVWEVKPHQSIFVYFDRGRGAKNLGEEE